MRILIVYNYLPTHMGGIETVIDELALEYARAGHEVTAVGADVPDQAVRPTPTAYRLRGVPVVNAIEERTGIPYPLPHPRLLSILSEEVATADVVYGHGFLAAPTLAAFTLARARGVRGPTRVLMEHVGFIDYESPVLATVERVAIETLGRATALLSEGIIVLNTRVAHEMRALAPGKPVEWIANGVDVDRYRPASPEERAALRRSFGWDDRPRVLFVGRVNPKKGLEIMLEVARQGQGAFDVVLVGPGKVTGEVPAHVEVLGALPPDRVAEAYRAADVFLLPSYGEGFPLTALEALSSGCPAMLGDDPTYGPYLEGAGTGLQTVPRDAGEITRRLRTLFASPKAMVQARRDALAHVRERFTWARTARLHQEFAMGIRDGRKAA